MTRFLQVVAISRLFTFVVFTGLLSSAMISQATAPVAAVNTTDGIGLKGYDPVAYFTMGKPIPGVDQYTYRWEGATYRFASAENQEHFKTNPAQYLPQYGGYCAYAMSINRIADIDPDRWAIVDGKLYLNNNFFAHTLWSVNKSENIAAADRNWTAFPKMAGGE